MGSAEIIESKPNLKLTSPGELGPGGRAREVAGCDELLSGGEMMETKNSRLGVWAVMLFTCFAFFGGQSAFAESGKPRAEAAGWICKPGGTAPNGCAEVKLGLTAKLNKSNMADGRFDYMNRATKYNVKGRINNLEVNPNPTAATHPCALSAIFVPVDPMNPTGPQIQVGGPPLNAPYAHVSGSCDGGDSCTFDVIVVDDDTAKKQPDWVCNLHMHGMDKKGTMEDYDDESQPLQHGNVEVHPQ